MIFRKTTVCAVLAFLLVGMVGAYSEDSYRIDSVTYDIKGSTREFPLTLAVPIDRQAVFPNKESLDAYIADLLVRFLNQRVLETATIDTTISQEPGTDGVYSVSLVIHTVDSWNIIALPKPGFDSNSGFEIKIKLKDYNFFGSMQELNSDISYAVDNDGKNSFAASVDFAIPFKIANHELKWTNDANMNLPLGETPEFEIGTALSIKLPVAFTNVIVTFQQKLNINDRDWNGVIFPDDKAYLTEKLTVAMPIDLVKFERIGNLTWQPSVSASVNAASDGIQHEQLQGIGLSAGHQLSIGRVDWIGNFREGFTLGAGNDYGYNTERSTSVDVSVWAKATGFLALCDFVGLNSRLKANHVIVGSQSTAIAEPLRGILNKRVNSDSYVSMNLDLPIKIMDIDFVDITGVQWTKFIGFEMQASPFFDVMLTHDASTGRYYALRDGWYSGGLEILVFLKKMRSITIRASAGYDLQDYVANGWSMRDRAGRDNFSTHEYVIGLGLHY